MNKYQSIALVFVVTWTIGSVFNASHLENIILSVFATLAAAIHYGVTVPALRKALSRT